MKSAFGVLQKIGKALMLPVAILPVAGILLGVGGALLSGAERGVLDLSAYPLLISLFEIMKASGEPIFANLPLIFAVGTALGLSKNDGVAGLAAIVGYVVMIGAMGAIAQWGDIRTGTILGMTSIDTGVFGGIIIGAVAAQMFNRFYKIQLPSYLGFFAGKRFVPIVTAFSAIAVAILLSIVWPPIQSQIDGLSAWAVGGNMGATVFVYGFVERLLIPFGLHHIWNAPFFFEIGEFVTPTGEVVKGELTRFFNGDPTAGNLGGGYLFKMFGLPAACLAMYHTAKPEMKARVGSIMASAALTSFLTGITEPIEFAFLFVAPALYGLHAILAGFAFVLTYSMGAKLGYTFSHGLIDFILFFAMDTKPWLIFILGPLWALVYYGVFRYAISTFDLVTPGRESSEDLPPATANTAAVNAAEPASGGSLSLPQGILVALGQKANIKSLDACITRLRVTVNSMDQVDDAQLKALGAAGVFKIGDNLQAIFGTQSENLKTEIEQLIESGWTPGQTTGSQAPTGKAATDAAASSSSSVDSQKDNAQESVPNTAATAEKDISTADVEELITALGGRDNVMASKPVAMTRLRVEVVDERKVSKNVLNDRYSSVQIREGLYHVLVGLQVQAFHKLFDSSSQATS